MNPLAWQYRELVQGLHSLQPKKRGNPVSWIILLGCAYVIGGLGMDRSVREALLSPAAPHNTPAFTNPAPLPPGAANARVSIPVGPTAATTPAAQQPTDPTVAALLAPTQPAPAAAPADLQQPDPNLPHAHAKAEPKSSRAHSGKRKKG